MKEELEENSETILKKFKGIKKNYSEEFDATGLLGEFKNIINKLDNDSITITHFYPFILKIKNSELPLSIIIEFLNAVNCCDFDDFIGFQRLISHLEKFKEFAEFNILICSDELDFSPLLYDVNDHIKIHKDLKNIENLIFESLSIENIIFNKTKNRYELIGVTPYGYNRDITLNWNKVLNGENDFYKSKHSIDLAFNDVLSLGGTNEY